MPAMVDRMAFVGSPDKVWWIGVEGEDHGQWKAREEAATLEELRQDAGLTWEVGMQEAEIVVPMNGSNVKVKIPNLFGIYRKDTADVLGYATGRYEPVQPERFFKFFDEILVGPGGEPIAVGETAGSLMGNKIIWALARLPEDLVINGSDVVQNYILGWNGYTGDTGYQFLNTPIRVVCRNTLNVATGNLSNQSGYRLSHFRNINQRLNAEEARTALGLVLHENTLFGEQAHRLGQLPISEEEVTGLTQRLFPLPALAGSVGPEKAILEGSLLLLPEPRSEDYTPAMDFTNIFQKREVVAQLYHSGAGNDHPDVAGTRWAAFNAVAEYTDYVAGWDSKRHEQLLFGSGRWLKQQAWNLLTKAPA